MNFLQKYKQRECKTLIGKALQMLVFHNLTRLAFFTAIGLIGAIGLGVFESTAVIFQVFLLTGVFYLGIMVVILIIFAWIINPIRTWRENHKK